MPIEVLMPALSPTMEEGTLSRWLVKEGDEVKSGDVIAEIETDKATMEVEAVDEGRVGKILVEEGSEGVKVNAVIAVLLEEGEDESALKSAQSAGSQKPAPKDEGKGKEPKSSEPPAERSESRGRQQDKNEVPDRAKSASGSSAKGGKDSRLKASPLAKRMAEQEGLDLSDLEGSGPNGRIVKRDVEAALSQGVSKAAKKDAAQDKKDAPAKTEPGKISVASLNLEEGSYEVVPLDGMRKTIARRMTASFRDVPHFPLSIDLELDALLKLRSELNAKAPEGVKVSVNDMLIRACALALIRVPESNASYTDEGLVMHKHADVAVAVAIEGGLITPVIKKAETKGLAKISEEMKDLAARARERKLKPEEFQGGTFSISNLGMMGIKSFASIINEPQGMILSVGAGEKRPVVKNDALAIATVMTVTLTCDHRVVDGAAGAKFLAALKPLVEDPVTMLL
ncbi:pyruvate dehydrogenase complex, E2 component, dihydrolipoamide acetyltransferase [Glycocaulis alkaliphilus]|uniref:Acetyltransferase component of pyruvate dehydrogenase complex n=1 Tax=Glycocaulis alkaliphilus TaxID=1434191 RepID=A0A3T0EBB9_9PROT|nr:pyruvate dehydrogenase complex dihydrolipoamide acetyltransferase [Glycocaulis alkaliphilus]AZU04268.1 pyruvate dehydrogenase complex, E2 component, dihydrolipoamide acetyltransferase [Glycocaulis alkaliphilus]GGB77121.1 acetyltransferase component of pyruvate dehydrogenase complex [Glycocaulis alkaliphilus]